MPYIDGRDDWSRMKLRRRCADGPTAVRQGRACEDKQCSCVPAFPSLIQVFVPFFRIRIRIMLIGGDCVDEEKEIRYAKGHQ
jgi:hypothetical protein